MLRLLNRERHGASLSTRPLYAKEFTANLNCAGWCVYQQTRLKIPDADDCEMKSCYPRSEDTHFFELPSSSAGGIPELRTHKWLNSKCGTIICGRSTSFQK